MKHVLRDRAQKTFAHLIYVGLISFGLVLGTFDTGFAQQLDSSDSSSSTCETKDCDNSTCALSKNSQGALTASSTRSHPSATCIINETSDSCFNPIPMVASESNASSFSQKINIAAEAGSRSCSVGHASCTDTVNNLRNHYGNDYGTGGLTGVKATAPADGKIISCRLMSGGGRAIVMEHPKNCQCSAGNSGGTCATKYTTIMMHLAAWVVNGQSYKDVPSGCTRSVKKGEVIGIVGGSNYSPLNESGYAIHLHLEVWNGARTWGASDQVLSALCDDMQSFCGGCTNTERCGNAGMEQVNGEGGEISAGGDSSASGGSSSSVAQAQAALEKCFLNQYLPDPDGCYFCPLFKVIFNTASVTALKSYNALAKGVANLVLAAFAIWISLVVLKYISAFESKDPRKMLQELLIQAFRVLVVWIILQGSFFQVMQLTLAPVFNTGMTFTQQLTNAAGCNADATYIQGVKGYDTTFTEDSTGGLPKSMGENVLCSLKSVENSVGRMMAYGRQAICLSMEEPYVWLKFVPHFGLLLTGLLITIAAVILLVAFPWCLVDCVLNMCIAAGLAPAAIGAWAFKATGQYLKKLWDFFMNAMFNFVFLSIIIYIILTALEDLMEPLTSKGESIEVLLDPIEGLAYWGIFGLKLTVICLLGWVFLDEGKNFAKKFASANGIQAGRAVGGAFAQAGKAVGKTAGKAGLATAKGVGQIGNHFIGQPIRRRYNKFRINRTKNKGKAIRDANGNIVAYERTRRNLWTGFKKVTSRVDVDEDGKETWSRSKQGRLTDIRNAAINWTNKRRLKKLMEKGQTFVDENGNIAYQLESNPWYRLGRKVTLTATQDKDGNFKFSKDIASLRMMALAKMTKNGSAINQFANKNMVRKHKDLNGSQAGTTFSSDQLMSVRQEKDRNGNIIAEKITFNTQLIKHLVNKDGTMNMQMVRQMMAGTKFNKETVYKALTQEVLKQRGVPLDEKFIERKTIYQDNVLYIIQKNFDGSETKVKMAFGGPQADQMLTDVITTARNGSYTRSLDNGIMKKEIHHHAGKQKAEVAFQFADAYYHNSAIAPLSQNGQFGPQISKDKAMFGFTGQDLDMHLQQLRTKKAVAISAKDGAQQVNFGTPNENNRTNTNTGGGNTDQGENRSSAPSNEQTEQRGTPSTSSGGYHSMADSRTQTTPNAPTQEHAEASSQKQERSENISPISQEQQTERDNTPQEPMSDRPLEENISQSDASNEDRMQEQIATEQHEKAEQIAKAKEELESENKRLAEEQARKREHDQAEREAQDKRDQEQLEREEEDLRMREEDIANEKAASIERAREEEERLEKQEQEQLDRLDQNLREQEKIEEEAKQEAQKAEEASYESQMEEKRQEEENAILTENAVEEKSRLEEASDTTSRLENELSDQQIRQDNRSQADEDHLRQVTEETETARRDEDIFRHTAQESDLARADSDRAYAEAKEAAKREALKAEQATEHAEQEKAEKEIREAHYRHQLEEGRERREKAKERAPEGMPERKIDKREMLGGGLTKERNHDRGKPKKK